MATALTSEEIADRSKYPKGIVFHTVRASRIGG